MREATIERNHCAAVRASGGEAYKFVSPGRRGVPDRLMLMPVDKRHISIVAKYVRFVEFKAPGKFPTPAQVREHIKLINLGFNVSVVDK